MLVPGIRSFESHRADLEALVRRRFADGDRVVVPVLGSGVNLQAAREVGAAALDWEHLLTRIERADDLVWDGTPPRSMTARWEALTQRQSQQRASDREAALVRRVVEALDRQTDRIWETAGGPPPLYGELLGKGFRDLISLNFDDRIARTCGHARLFRAVSPQGTRMPTGTAFSVLPQLYQRYHLHQPRFARVWHPHGRTAARSTIVLGVGCYGRLVPDLDIGWRRYKAAEREFGSERGRDRVLFPEPRPRRTWTKRQIARWLEHRRAPGPYRQDGGLARRLTYRRPQEALSWLDVFVMSPLLFIGCRLGGDEFPLWWALHQRARNQARHPPNKRVPAVLITAPPAETAAVELDHLRGGPGGLSTIVFPSWARLWDWVRSI